MSPKDTDTLGPSRSQVLPRMSLPLAGSNLYSSAIIKLILKVVLSLALSHSREFLNFKVTLETPKLALV